MIATLGDKRLSFGQGSAHSELRWMLSHSRAPKIRSRREFAEQELVLPEGPFKGRRFKVARQPFAGLWLDAVDGNLAYQPGGRFRRIVTTGPSQSGKSWIATILPLMYHLFEIGEAVGFALPDMDMADDKWRKDLLPVIEKTRFRDCLPTKGEGSQGGKVKNMVLFKNGASLKFFSAGGGDKSRAHATCRVLVITEANAFGGSAEASNESTKLEQLFARTRSFGSTALIYLECTVEVDHDVIWSSYQAGTASKIMCPCPHCGVYVAPEREHLVGWQDAADAEDARAKGHFQCPACEHVITDDERRVMNEQSLLLHRGQSIEPRNPKSKNPKLKIAGDPPRTDALGFRWSAFNNLFAAAGDLAAEEWSDARAVDEDAAARKQSQFVWCVPYTAAGDEQQTLNANALMTRQGPPAWSRGIVPADTFCLVAKADIGKHQLHYVVQAWTETGRVHFVDYRWLKIHGDELGAAVAILQALRSWRDEAIMPGFAIQGEKTRWVPDQVWVDARFQGEHKGDEAVFDFMRDRETERDRFRPTMGFGAGRAGFEHYRRPKSTTKTITAVGDGYHFELDRVHGLNVVHIDADHWKGFFHDRLLAPLHPQDDAARWLPGCATLFHTPERKEHEAICKHWSAERRVREYIPGKGVITRFERLRRTNHYLDCSSDGSAAAHFCGVRLTLPAAPPPPPAPTNQPRAVELPDGRPFFILDRQ